jgi:hypothetical protein
VRAFVCGREEGVEKKGVPTWGCCQQQLWQTTGCLWRQQQLIRMRLQLLLQQQQQQQAPCKCNTVEPLGQHALPG